MRMPATLIQGADGKDMENHPRPVDLPVTRPIGESYTGKDSQLDVGLRELLAQLAKLRGDCLNDSAGGLGSRIPLSGFASDGIP
jgi:hypothetical protein